MLRLRRNRASLSEKLTAGGPITNTSVQGIVILPALSAGKAARRRISVRFAASRGTPFIRLRRRGKSQHEIYHRADSNAAVICRDARTKKRRRRLVRFLRSFAVFLVELTMSVSSAGELSLDEEKPHFRLNLERVAIGDN